MIPARSRIIVNAWAIGRDPRYWDDAEEFKPKRFEKNMVDFTGSCYEYLPFGAGRRMCPGVAYGIPILEMALVQLLYHFDWSLPKGVVDVDMEESSGLGARRKTPLLLFKPKPRFLRVNTLRTSTDSVIEELNKIHKGKASCMVAVALCPEPGWKVIDACAAPGNKTVHLAALMNGEGSITACELNKERTKTLQNTIRRSGANSILSLSFCVSPDVYRALMKELAQTLDKQFSGNSESRAAGMIINTMGWVENLGLELLHNSIEIFKANEKLWKMLKDAAKNKPNIDVVKLHKSEGVVPRNPKYRQKTRSFRIKEYFYGIANDLAPHSNVVNFSDVSVYKIGTHQAPKSALPIGAEPVADPTRLVAVNISTDMVHTVLAVSYAKEPDEIVSSNVAGFIHVTDVDIQRKKLTYIAPCPGDLPSKLLIASSLTWYEA
ncbi:hypothetical protein OsI_06380 [Oryza sativa Indica Group]|uniref:Uncharacterized protein n=1 Tax=Oryza sativa subsp. indica TaxID=39946 RepID=B8AE77_ORYSI|nr:hypothetical protein OsI_06380 [Oryza sativa Indica Group]